MLCFVIHCQSLLILFMIIINRQCQVFTELLHLSIWCWGMGGGRMLNLGNLYRETTIRHSWMLTSLHLRHGWMLASLYLRHSWMLASLYLRHSWMLTSLHLKHGWMLASLHLRHGRMPENKDTNKLHP